MMADDLRNLQRRLARLEREVKELRLSVAKRRKTKEPPWWQKIAGRFEDDPAFAEIVRLGRKFRKQDKEGKR
jgi:hypothetical protein